MLLAARRRASGMSEEESVEILIIGGGVCGVLAGQRCAAKGLSFRLVDEGIDFGGTWSSLANTHSQLQVGQVYFKHKDASDTC